jgi:hypothetical protein
VSYSDDLHAGATFAKDKRVREPAKQNAARSVFKRGKSLRFFRNLLHRVVKLSEERFRGSEAALRIPVNRGPCLLKSIRMDLEGLGPHAGN